MVKSFIREAGGRAGRQAGRQADTHRQTGGQAGRQGGGQGCVTPLLQGFSLLQLLNKALPGLSIRQVLGQACTVQ